MDKNLKIAVALGGPGSEHDVSMESGRAVIKALTNAGCNVEELVVDGDSIEVPEGVDVVFNTIHGTFGEDGTMQKQLEDLGVAYTGGGSVSSALAFDKVLSKEKFIEKGVPTPASEIVDCTEGFKMPQMKLPYVVKPPREGSSVGVSICNTPEEAEAAMKEAVKYSHDVLVEQLVVGEELTVGVLDGEVLPVVHIIPDGGKYDMATKYPGLYGTGESKTQYICPAKFDDEITKAIQDAALAAHKSLGVEVYSRVDVLLDEDNKPYVLEANTIPGMTATSLLPKSAGAAGYTFDELCMKIIDLSISTSRG